MHSPLWFVVALTFGLAAVLPAADGPLAYPPTKKVDHADEYHGAKVPDPYRWLETDVRTAPEVAAWVAAENKVTDAFLSSIPERDAARPISQSTAASARTRRSAYGAPEAPVTPRKTRTRLGYPGRRT